MRVLLYSQMGSGHGGGETVFERVTTGLKQRGHNVTRSYCDHDVPNGHVQQQSGGLHLSLTVPPTAKSFLRPSYAYRFICSALAAYRLIRSTRPEVVNVHFFTRTSLLFALLKPLFGYRLVISCHGSDVTNIRAFHKRVAPFILSRADVVTVVSDSLAEKLRRQVPGAYKVQTIHNGIDVQFWGGSETERQTRETHVVSVGALKPVKGHDVLIRAFAQITDGHPDATLQIIGDGSELSSYQRLVKNLGLTSKVDFSGWIDHEGVRSALQQASVFVFPSRHEGFGIALVEAMATGCPIVASEVGGIPEVVHGTNAILIPPEDSEALAEAIDVALRDDSWRETARALGMERALQFTWTSSIDRYESVLEA